MNSKKKKKLTKKELTIALFAVALIVVLISRMQGEPAAQQTADGRDELTLISAEEERPVSQPVAGTAQAEQEPASENAGYFDLSTVSDSSELPYTDSTDEDGYFDLSTVADFSGAPYTEINGNVPFFTEEDMTTDSYESYSPLDELGRCGVCMACIGTDLMPEGDRGNISSVHPSGWHSVRYDCVEQESLYNRSHLIAYQLAGENANERNLISGTRYLNAYAMLDFEESVGDYVRETGNHVLYRVTPDFRGNELIARGLLMEAMSVEDNGRDILYCVYCYNVQPGILIDYETGDSELAPPDGEVHSFVINTNSRKIHLPSCQAAIDMKEKNKQEYVGTYEDLVAQGYVPCPDCHPAP